MITIFFFLTIQCTWTPEVETPIHQSQEGAVLLQTFSEFTIPPQHPHVVSESRIKQILQGISQRPGQGILQELFLSDSTQYPIFSHAQINFLAPHLIEAFSKATAEEIILFRSSGNEEGATQISGTIAIFSPAIFFLTLHHSGNYPENLSKMTSSSRNLHKQPLLMYSEKEAVLELKEAKRFMKIPTKDSWIAIDYARLRPFKEHVQEAPQQPAAPTTHSASPSLRIKTLEEQLQDLRRKVDEQAEEIQRLQQTAP